MSRPEASALLCAQEGGEADVWCCKVGELPLQDTGEWGGRRGDCSKYLEPSDMEPNIAILPCTSVPSSKCAEISDLEAQGCLIKSIRTLIY